MAELDRDGVRIGYTVHTGGPGVPVLMTHGFTATRAMHEVTVPALVPGRTCITWDVRGHGETDTPTDPAQYSIPLTLDDMRAILDAAGIDRAVLLGHSMGGFLSMSFQRRFPERVAGLVLVGTGPGYRSEEPRAGWNRICEAYARAFEARGLDALLDSPEVHLARHAGPEGLVLAARGILRQHDADVIDHLADIDVPVLLVVGSEDAPFVEGMAYMARKIAGSRHVVIDGAGHAPMVTHGAVYDPAVAQFLDDVDDTAG